MKTLQQQVVALMSLYSDNKPVCKAVIEALMLHSGFTIVSSTDILSYYDLCKDF